MKGPLLITGFLIVGLAGSRELPRTSPDVVIYEGRYPGWPWIAAGDDDAFYCVFREGTIHGYSADGSVMFTKSTDRGRSWSPARVIADAPEVDDRNAAIVVLRGGELLVTAKITLTGYEETSKEDIEAVAYMQIHYANWADPD